MECRSVEEVYEYAHPLVKCDICKREAFPMDVHFMQSFHHSSELVVCRFCLNKLENSKEEEDEL